MARTLEAYHTDIRLKPQGTNLTEGLRVVALRTFVQLVTVLPHKPQQDKFNHSSGGITVSGKPENGFIVIIPKIRRGDSMDEMMTYTNRYGLNDVRTSFYNGPGGYTTILDTAMYVPIPETTELKQQSFGFRWSHQQLEAGAQSTAPDTTLRMIAADLIAVHDSVRAFGTGHPITN